jgi:hypothetical protein
MTDTPDPSPALPIPLPRQTSVVMADTVLPQDQLDYLLLVISIRIQHLRHAEARVLVEGLLALGVETVEVLMAKAVVDNALGHHTDVLATLTRLDRLDPPEYRKGRKVDPRVRMRSFLKAHATYALQGSLDAEGRASLDFYLRQGGQDEQQTG